MHESYENQKLTKSVWLIASYNILLLRLVNMEIQQVQNKESLWLVISWLHITTSALSQQNKIRRVCAGSLVGCTLWPLHLVKNNEGLCLLISWLHITTSALSRQNKTRRVCAGSLVGCTLRPALSQQDKIRRAWAGSLVGCTLRPLP